MEQWDWELVQCVGSYLAHDGSRLTPRHFIDSSKHHHIYTQCKCIPHMYTHMKQKHILNTHIHANAFTHSYTCTHIPKTPHNDLPHNARTQIYTPTPHTIEHTNTQPNTHRWWEVKNTSNGFASLASSMSHVATMVGTLPCSVSLWICMQPGCPGPPCRQGWKKHQ